MYQPTLVLALGGTGKEVVLRIRRKFFEAGIQVQPWLRYLWIDTAVSNPKERKIEGQPLDYIAYRTSFLPEESCDIGVDTATLDNISNNLDDHPHIKEWVDPILFTIATADAAALTTGAKQMPPLGRLALFVNALKIRDAITKALNALTHNSIGSALTIALNNKLISPQIHQSLTAPNPGGNNHPLRIYIVGSLSGGTGAGCCVDIAGMLRSEFNGTSVMFPTHGGMLRDAEVLGNFLLPGAFTADSTPKTNFDGNRVHANGYAMLQEIEAQQLRIQSRRGDILTGGRNEGRLRASWLNNEDPQTSEFFPAPLYSGVMLFDSGSGAQKFDLLRDSYGVMANLLYGDLSAIDHSARNAMIGNASNFHHGMFGHLETTNQAGEILPVWKNNFSVTFGSAGFARITFEAPRIRLMAGYTLALQAMDLWRGPSRAATDEFKRLRQTVRHRWYRELESNRQKETWTSVADTLVKSNADEAFKAAVKQHPAEHAQRLGSTALPTSAEMALLEAMRREYLIPTGAQSGRFEATLKELITDKVSTHAIIALDSVAFKTTSLDNPQELFQKPQGGIAAAWISVGLPGEQPQDGELSQNLAYYEKFHQKKLNDQVALRDGNKKLALAACDKADKAARILASAQAKGMVWESILEKLAAEAVQTSDAAVTAAKEYFKACKEHALRESLAGAYRRLNQEMLDKTRINEPHALSGLIAHWATGCTNGNAWIDKIYTEMTRILTEIRNTPEERTTKHLLRSLQTDPKELQNEIERTYAATNGSVINDLKLVQRNILSAGAALVNARVANAAVRFDCITHLASHSLLIPTTLVNPNQVEFDLQVHNTIQVALSATKANELLTNRDGQDRHNVQHHLQAHSHDLITWSSLRTELTATSKIVVAGRSTSNLPFPVPNAESRYIVASQVAPGFAQFNPVAPFPLDVTEARIVQFRTDLALPFFAPLGLGFQVYDQAYGNKGEFHFSNPKAGYQPIHRMSARQAKILSAVFEEVILALMIGQLSTTQNNLGAHLGGFNWYIDLSVGTPLPLGSVSSGDIRDFLVSSTQGQNIFRHLELRNTAFLKTLHPHALEALRIVVDYNARYCARRVIEWGTGNFHFLADDGPASLILERIRNRIQKCAEDIVPQGLDGLEHGIRLRRCLGDLMHFYTHFVPLNLGNAQQPVVPTIDSPLLLCLHSRVAAKDDFNNARTEGQPQKLDLSRQGIDITDGELRSIQNLGLWGPWALFKDNSRSRETRAIHETLVQAEMPALNSARDLSMLPNHPGSPPAPRTHLAGPQNLFLERLGKTGDPSMGVPVWSRFLTSDEPVPPATSNGT
jgi:hypothetical protein